MAEPIEIIAAPLSLYLAPVDTAFPDIDEAPGVDWVLVGESGTLNETDDGVTVTHGQEISEWTPAGATVPRKVWRVAESLTVNVGIADLSTAFYAKIMNGASVTTVAAGVGIAGNKSFELFRGLQVETYALLARGISPENEDLNAQYEVPRVYEGADSIDITYNKGEPAILTCEFTALSDDTGNFGVFRTGTAPAS